MNTLKAIRTKEDISTNPTDWVDLYADHLYRFAYIRVTDKEIAEELVQETFIAALSAEKKNRFRGNASEKTWMTGILKNKIIDHIRKKYRHRAVPLEMIDENQMEDSFDTHGNWRVKPGRWGKAPPDQYEQKELSKILMDCLKTLREKQADAIRLREIIGEESEEICKVLNISTTHFWVLMHRARLALRRCIERQWIHDI